jgi:hypothetical protein
MPPKANLLATYRLKRGCKDQAFEVEIMPDIQKLQVYVDGIPEKGVDGAKRLENLGQFFNVKSNSGPSRVWNWIVQEGVYTWSRFQ